MGGVVGGVSCLPGARSSGNHVLGTKRWRATTVGQGQQRVPCCGTVGTAYAGQRDQNVGTIVSDRSNYQVIGESGCNWTGLNHSPAGARQALANHVERGAGANAGPLA